MSRKGNNGNNLDLMVSVRHDLGKNDITAHALLEIQKMIDLVSGPTIYIGEQIPGTNKIAKSIELNEEGIRFSNNYKYDDREIITIFEGEEVGTGHDGEIVAKCEKILWQGNSEEITNIFYDDDIEDKVAEVLKIIE